MQVVLAEEWAKRLPGVAVNAVHPGWVDTPGIPSSLPTFKKLTRPILRTPEQGADTFVWMVAAREPGRSPASFFHDRAVRPEHYTRFTRESAGRAATPCGTRSSADVDHPGRLLDAAADVRRQAPRSRRSRRAAARGGRAQGARGARRATCAARPWPTPRARRTARSPPRSTDVRVMTQHAHRRAGGRARARGLDPRDRPAAPAAGARDRRGRRSRTSCSPASAASRRCGCSTQADGEALDEWRFTLVEGISRREALTMQFAENFHQSKPEPVQFARAARLIMAEDPSLTAAEVSRIVGAPPAWTRKALRLLELPEAIVERVERGDLSFTAADFVRRGGRARGRDAPSAPRSWSRSTPTARSAASSSSTASATSRRRRRTTRRSPTGWTPRAARPPQRRASERRPRGAAPSRLRRAAVTTAAQRPQRRRRRRLRPRRLPLPLRDRAHAQAAADHGRGGRARVRPLAAPARAPAALRSFAREVIEE